jgi:hypothetical protein
MFIRGKPIFSSDIRTITARVHLKKKKSLVVRLKGLGPKMN